MRRGDAPLADGYLWLACVYWAWAEQYWVWHLSRMGLGAHGDAELGGIPCAAFPAEGSEALGGCCGRLRRLFSWGGVRSFSPWSLNAQRSSEIVWSWEWIHSLGAAASDRAPIELGGDCLLGLVDCRFMAYGPPPSEVLN